MFVFYYLWKDYVEPCFQELLFVEQLTKNMNPMSRFADVAMVCCIDLCRAAARTRPEGDTALRSFAPEVADEIKVSPDICFLSY